MTEHVHAESPADAIARWQDWQATTCGPSTIRQRADDVERLREHAAARRGRPLDQVDARHLTAEDIAAYLARPISANSKVRYSKSYVSWFGWLHRTGRIPADPMVDLNRPRPRQGVPDPLTADEVDRVFDGADERLWAVMALALFAGLRAHEVARFTGEQIRGRHLIVTGKGGKPARLPVARQLADVAARMPRSGPWFPSPKGGHLHENYIGEMVAERFRAVGIPRGSIHRLRHTFGTLVHREHRDLLVTQRLLRHASVATTMIYTAVEDDDMTSALAGLPMLSA